MTHLSVEDFGMELLRTRDLDPVYVALAGAELPRPQLHRWLLAYWCFYHTGAASAISERAGQHFWDMMKVAANNVMSPAGYSSELPEGRWPRASERRYFRGDKCVRAVEWLGETFQHPEEPVEQLKRSTVTEKDVMAFVGTWPLFGPWIGFKAADMLERCAGIPVTFSRDVGLMYSSPRESLDLLAQERGTTAEEQWENLLNRFSNEPAPPGYDRGCGVQECETLACKFLQHRYGRYSPGKDILEIRHALKGWGETADKLLAAAPKEVS